MLIVETTVATPGWDAAFDWEGLATRAGAAALAETPHAGLDRAGYEVEVAVRLSDDAEVHKLNAQYRHKDQPTNVLSFPMVQPDLIEGLANSDDGEVLLGDIILAYETVAREAGEKSLSVEDHAAHLIVHGVLHLLGYDHGDDVQGTHMESIETAALARLGLADPYAA
jgi:probable rRNA maturation factor